MTEREAFRRAVEICLEDNWRPSLPDQPTLLVDDKHCTLRQICELVFNFDDALPDDVGKALLYVMRDIRHADLKAYLGRYWTYAAGAKCLVKFMEAEIKVFKKRRTN